MDFSNVLSVLAVTVLNIFLGMAWYSPLLLGSIWAKAYRFDVKKLKATFWHYAGSILVSLVTASILAILIHQFQVETWECGMLLGICLWIGFIVTSHFSGVIWARKPLLVYLVDISYHLVSIVMMSVLLTVW